MAGTVSALWVSGKMGPYENLCLESFVRLGYKVRLFTYDAKMSVHPEIEVLEASDVLALEGVSRDFFNLGMFPQLADLFRYSLLSREETTWVDTDMFCLNANLPDQAYLFGYEDGYHVNTAILRYPKDSILAKEMLKDAKSKELKDITWSEIGPKLLTTKLHDLKLSNLAMPKESFYPVHYTEIGMLFDPAMKDLVSERLNESYGIHFWNEILRQEDPVKQMHPPLGSWLSDQFMEFNLGFQENALLKVDWAKQALKHPKSSTLSIDGLVAERDGLVAERDGLVAERDGLVAERDGLVAERDGLVAERDGHVATLGWKFSNLELRLRSLARNQKR